MDKLEQVIAKQEIYDVLVRYCRGIDRLDVDLVASVYHPDAQDKHGPYCGLGRELAKELVDWCRRDQDGGIHQISNVHIEFDGPDRAWVESYYNAIHRVKGGLEDIGGRYVDRFERRNGEWKIADRRVIIEFSRIVDSVKTVEYMGLFDKSKRDKTDISYER